MKEKQLKNEELEQVTGGLLPVPNKKEIKPEVDNIEVGGDPSTDEQAPIY